MISIYFQSAAQKGNEEIIIDHQVMEGSPGILIRALLKCFKVQYGGLVHG